MSRRARIAGGILALWLVGLGLLARRELFRPESDRIAEAALRVSPGAVYYVVEQDGRRIGYSSSTIDTTARGISVSDYLVADLAAGGSVHRATGATRVGLSRALRMTDFDVAVVSGESRVRASGTVDGDSALVVAVQLGDEPADTTRVAVHGPVLLPTLVPLVVALGEPPKVGKTYALPTFDPSSMRAATMRVEIRAESLFTVVDSARRDEEAGLWVPARSDTVRAWQIVPAEEVASGPMVWRAGWVDEQGRLVEARLPGGLVLRREAYEMAFENWRRDAARRSPADAAAGDVIERSAIAAGAALDRTRLSRLRVALEGVPLVGFELDGAPRQSLAGDTLTVAIEPPEALGADYQLPGGATIAHPELAPLLRAEPLVESGHPQIRALARRIAGDSRDPAVVARRLARWVHDSLEKRVVVGVPSALSVMRSRAGDCNEHTQLYVALARAAGIPARGAAGLAYVRGKFYYHAWPEIWLRGWVPVDPTFDQFPADAAHLRFVSGGPTRQAELLRLVDRLRLRVVSTE